MSVKATTAELEYVVKDAQADIIVAQKAYLPKIEPLKSSPDLEKVPVMVLDEFNIKSPNSQISKSGAVSSEGNQGDCLIVYTSGTTGKPKGVMHTHKSVVSQVKILEDYWGWTNNDRILNVLPMHHVHGLINVMHCALWSQATCELAEHFHVESTWKALLRERNDPEA